MFSELCDLGEGNPPEPPTPADPRIVTMWAGVALLETLLLGSGFTWALG